MDLQKGLSLQHKVP